MFEAIVRALIAICLFVAAAVLVLWVLGQLGIVIPATLVHIFYVILALVCILVLYRILKPSIGTWFP
jgi:hypothetical protein